MSYIFGGLSSFLVQHIVTLPPHHLAGLNPITSPLADICLSRKKHRVTIQLLPQTRLSGEGVQQLNSAREGIDLTFAKKLLKIYDKLSKSWCLYPARSKSNWSQCDLHCVDMHSILLCNSQILHCQCARMQFHQNGCYSIQSLQDSQQQHRYLAHNRVSHDCALYLSRPRGKTSHIRLQLHSPPLLQQPLTSLHFRWAPGGGLLPSNWCWPSMDSPESAPKLGWQQWSQTYLTTYFWQYSLAESQCASLKTGPYDTFESFLGPPNAL